MRKRKRFLLRVRMGDIGKLYVVGDPDFTMQHIDARHPAHKGRPKKVYVSVDKMFKHMGVRV